MVGVSDDNVVWCMVGSKEVRVRLVHPVLRR